MSDPTVGYHRILLSESDAIRLSENVGNRRISPVSDCRIMSDFLGSDGVVSTWVFYIDHQLVKFIYNHIGKKNTGQIVSLWINEGLIRWLFKTLHHYQTWKIQLWELIKEKITAFVTSYDLYEFNDLPMRLKFVSNIIKEDKYDEIKSSILFSLSRWHHNIFQIVQWSNKKCLSNFATITTLIHSVNNLRWNWCSSCKPLCYFVGHKTLILQKLQRKTGNSALLQQELVLSFITYIIIFNHWYRIEETIT